MSTGDIWESLKQRKLAQWAIAYVAAAFALLQGVDIVAQRFGWPEAFERILIIALCIGFFITLLLAWYHGERGAQKVSGTELLLLALLLAIGGGLAWKFAPGSLAVAVKPADATASAAPAADISAKSVAVLPFSDLSPAHDQEYFSDGMAEEILNALAQIKDLKVAGRTSSFFFKGKNEDLRAIGKTLGVANVLEGSVRKQGDKVRITAQLIQASDGFHLWSNSYDGDLKDVFELQERIARAITEQLKVVLAGEQKTRLVPVATSSPEAYALYLQAAAIFNRRDGPHFSDAIADLKEAIRLDPKYARAHARLASFHAIANNYDNTVNLTESQASSEHEARIAIDLDPTLAEPHAALGVIHEYRREWVAARESLEHAVTLDPNDPTAAFWLGLSRYDAGYRRLGIASIDRALSIDPLLPNALAWRAFCYLDAGDQENARRTAQRSADQGLGFAEVILALLSHAEGHDADAVARFARGSRGTLNGFPADAGALLAQGIFGDAASRAKAVGMVNAYLATGRKTVSAGAPWALLQLGEPARALALVEDPQTSNDTIFMMWLWSSRGNVARALPRFPEFARKTRLTEMWEKYGAPDDCERKGPNDYVCH